MRLVLGAAHLVVAVLFLLRGPELARASWTELALATPGLVLGGLAFKLAEPPATWPPMAVALLALGAVFACGSLAVLGRSFAMLPGRRELVARGPYRLVRHPAYLGESVMVASCVVAGAPISVALAVLPALVLRIVVEERVLGRGETWEEYSRLVPYRLVPWVW
ncbi:MAG: hypothetical protein GY913_33235 [Proteobacteria bacterium]|nr:hypothetical protein [Pseudomonadota bacterium]MCP4921790.1 hypothetical protein [Pseudomonadota bacterium]